MSRFHPPRALLHFFRWFCRPDLHKYIEGDLLELYEERCRIYGRGTGNALFAWDVILLFRPGIIHLKGNIQSINHSIMFSNYVKVALRNMLRYKGFSFINVFGLALAMSVSMLIILMLADQLAYDKFHVNGDRIYRILSAGSYSTSPFPLANALRTEYTIAEDATQLTPAIGGDGRYGNNVVDMRGYFTDPSFFHVLGFELEKGNKDNALSQPRSMIISSEIAALLFQNEDPMGKTISFEDRKLPFPQEYEGVGSPPVSWGEFTVTGVIDEKKFKSHLKFDVLISASTMPGLAVEKKLDDNSDNWGWYFRTYTFVKLKERKVQSELNAALKDIVKKKFKNIHLEHTKNFQMEAQSLNDIQFEMKGNDTGTRLPKEGYYFLGGLALIVMFSACLNYTNLSVARALTRAREIGIRKVTGANRTALIIQFLSESVLTAFSALALAMLLMTLLKPAFMTLWVNKYLNFELSENTLVLSLFAGLALLVGIVAGVYPAFRLSSFKPVRALKAISESKTGKLRLFKILSVSQFIISFFFITTSILVFSQFRHYMNFNYGFNPQGIINVQLQGHDFEKIASEFRNVAGVELISASDLIPSTGTNNGDQFKRADAEEDDFHFFSVLNVDENFLENLNVQIIAGQSLPAIKNDGNTSIVVNESVAKKLGFDSPADIVGETIHSKWGQEDLTVVGVVANFRYKLLIDSDEIGELILRNEPSAFQYLNVGVREGQEASVVALMDRKWKLIDPLHSFKFRYFEDELATTHQAIFDIVRIIGFIALLSIVIACLGLLGMSTYTAERKRKEVGIRKILGAENFGIAILLSRGFLKLLTISVVVGGPLTYFVNSLWLQRLANRVEFSAGMLIAGASILLALGLLTIASQAIRAASANPVESLKVE